MNIASARRLFLLLFVFLGCQITRAQSTIALLIPDSLKANAHSVIRLYEETFFVKNPSEATQKYHYIITILDQRGQDNATVSVFHDKHVKINDMEAVIYDAFGKQVKKMRRADIVDINYVSSGSLFEDNKIKTADLKYANYPYTIEVTYEITTSNLLFFPKFFPQSDAGTAVEKAQLDIIVPDDVGLRYKALNGISSPLVTENGFMRTYHWELKNLIVKTSEDYSPENAKLGPGVLTAPNSFELEKTAGSMKTWKELGAFHYNLNKDRDILSAVAVDEAKKLVANEKDLAQKVKKIYEFVQGRTRYVSIQLGIGGWQTFEANTVADKGYGDCKALSNYTKALLRAVGIPAYQALVDADEPDQFIDFPCQNFNHVILCVPAQKDTIWLECTSQTQAFGYLSDFTEDRYVLLLTPDGGKITRTPLYKPSDNRQFRNLKVKMEDSGDAFVDVTTEYSGVQQDSRSNVIHQLGAKDQKEWLYKKIRIPSFEINTFEFKEKKDRVPVVNEKLSLLVRQYGSKSGNRMFINPNLLTTWTTALANAPKRKNDIELQMGFIDTDTVEISIPTEFKFEHTPSPLKIETKFGTYEISTLVKDNKVYYFRKMVMQKGTYPPTASTELADFFKKIIKADKSQIVLVKN